MNNLSKNTFVSILLLIVGLVFINPLGNQFYKRLDLTQDKRFTLAEETKGIIEKADSPIVVDVFLKGDFPPEFRKLQSETRQLLEEFSAENSNIKFDFINPTEKGAEHFEDQLEAYGMTPAQVTVMEGGKQSIALVYPWALAHYNGRPDNILPPTNQVRATAEERVDRSSQDHPDALSRGF